MRLLSAGFVCAIIFACGDSGSDNGGTGGGSNSSGGDSSTGGDASTDGGSTSGKGGGATTGGESTTTGGKSTATGGKASTGGTGGKASTGGAAGKGGSTSGGAVSTGGADAGGDTGTAGDTGTGGDTGVPDGLLNPDYITDWNPGILKDNTNQPLGADGIPQRTTVCATVAAGGNIQAAIDACAEGQVVELAAGAFSVANTINITKGIVLRGAGSGTGGTTITKTGGNTVIQIGTNRDSACYAGAFGTAYPLTKDAAKETNVVTIGANASTFKSGDLALIDEADDADVSQGDCEYYKRVSQRSLAQRVEVASVNATAGTITLTTPLHWTFRSAAPHSAQIARTTQALVKYAGIESVYLKGGTNPGWSGQMAGGIDISNAMNSWVKDVQTDGTIEGMHVAVTGSYRVVVRDSNFHHSAGYSYNADCYGIVMRCGSADGLVENNIVRYMNKPILFNASGGGNVIAYNYADNSWSSDTGGYQEVNIDCHCAFPHMELIEGNYAPHVGAVITHGNAGYLTYFRNYSSSQFAAPAVFGTTTKQTGNVAALQLDAGVHHITAVGNVWGSNAKNDLGTADLTSAYTSAGDSPATIIKVNTSNVAFTTLWWHANYDTVMNGVRYNPAISVRELPASLYRSTKPSWWPSGSPWPWSGSDLSPMVGTLPAKARSDAL